MKSSAVVIEGDLFDITARLKSIDDGYFIVYDKSAGAFEVHNSKQRGDPFSLRIPYSCLDCRTVDLVQKTRAENAQKLFEEMERQNELLAKKQQSEAIDSALRAAEKSIRNS